MRSTVGLAAMLVLASCSDDLITAPQKEQVFSAPGKYLSCSVQVAEAEMTCEDWTEGRPSGLRSALIIGGQDLYVRLTSSGTSYDSGTQIFSSTVAVQNLTQHLMGTDGSTDDGVVVFFHSGPTVTSGSGTVSVANPDGISTFTATNQPYFLYPVVLGPLEIAQGRLWQFNVPNTVDTFSFIVYVSASLDEESAPLLGPVWTGGANTTDWNTPGNWKDGEVPGLTSSVTLPTDSVVGSAPFPVLSADVQIADLRVGSGSVLNLGGNRLGASGNVDALGQIVNGVLEINGDSAYVGGNLPSTEVSAAARLQRATQVYGPLNLTGSLTTTANQPLTIAAP